MAKEFSKSFYASKSWQDCRTSYIQKVFGLCERCEEVGLILHHKIELTPYNVFDPEVTLNHDNLEFLCQTCHNREHHGNGDHGVTREGFAFDEQGNLIYIGDVELEQD